MPITIQDSTVIAGPTTIPFIDFPKWHAHHLNRYSTTPALEQEGSTLMQADFGFTELDHFIRGVCKWGRRAGIAVRVRNANGEDTITKNFREAVEVLSGNTNPEEAPMKALTCLNRIKCLGRPSFASKHLRFLRPDICAILDSLQSRNLQYRLKAEGYREISNDCRAVAAHLNREGPQLPSGRQWGAADAEMSIFACLYGANWGRDV
jgi:hypothetical protein